MIKNLNYTCRNIDDDDDDDDAENDNDMFTNVNYFAKNVFVRLTFLQPTFLHNRGYVLIQTSVLKVIRNINRSELR